MKSDLVKINMKHSKGVCENDSTSMLGDCYSNELLELFKSNIREGINICVIKLIV